MYFKRFIFIVVIFFAVPSLAKDNTDIRVDELIQKMTLEEKIGQMTQYNGFWDATGPTPSEGENKDKFEQLKRGLVGSVLNVSGTKQVKEFQDVAMKTRLGIPLIFGLDVIHGQKTIFPIPLGETSSWDLAMMERSAHDAAVEASAMGINWTFAPMMDVSIDPRWGRVMEGAGEDPYLGAKVAVARVKGFQGNDLSRPDSIAACAKHFAGYGFVTAGRDYNTVDVGTYTLYNTILPPFKASVAAGVKTVMNAFNTLNGTPSTASAFLQRDILKNQWGFQGIVVSDWASGREMIQHGTAKNLKEVAELALKAGSDMDMESYAYINHLTELVAEKKIDESLINDSVRRILKLKFELGLFDNPYKYINEKREKSALYNKKHVSDALDAARKSIVLLKNSKGILPFSKKIKNVAVIGALANDKNSPLGSWRMASDDNSAVSLIEGMSLYTNEFKYEQGARLVNGKESFFVPLVFNQTDRSGFDAAKKLAKSADVVVMMLGEHGFQTGEGRSQANLGFPGLQQELLEEIYSVNPNIVLLVSSGRPLVLDWADKHLSTIVQTWQLGTQSGHAIAQVLFGDYNPSGKLPMSFPRSVGQLPMTYRHYATGRPGPNLDVFWSHYTDESNDPLYPFGYGLSYTTFSYSNLIISKTENAKISVSVDITNTGKRDGEEVVQLYLHDKFASFIRPVKELKGFQKIQLKAGQLSTIKFELGSEELGFYSPEGKFLVEPGEFDVMVGTSSVSGISGTFSI